MNNLLILRPYSIRINSILANIKLILNTYTLEFTT